MALYASAFLHVKSAIGFRQLSSYAAQVNRRPFIAGSPVHTSGVLGCVAWGASFICLETEHSKLRLLLASRSIAWYYLNDRAGAA